jgi:hypothetical protein
LTGADSAPQADPDHDGADNLTEFAYNLNPLVSDAVHFVPGGTNGLPMARFLPNVLNGTLEVQFVRRKGPTATGLSYSLQFSGDLVTWSAGLPPGVSSLGQDWERIIARDSVSGQHPGRFARLVVTLQP